MYDILFHENHEMNLQENTYAVLNACITHWKLHYVANDGADGGRGMSDSFTLFSNQFGFFSSLSFIQPTVANHFKVITKLECNHTEVITVPVMVFNP